MNFLSLEDEEKKAVKVEKISEFTALWGNQSFP